MRIKLISQQPTCTPVFKRFLSRLLKEIQRVGMVRGHFTCIILSLNTSLLIVITFCQTVHAVILWLTFDKVSRGKCNFPDVLSSIWAYSNRILFHYYDRTQRHLAQCSRKWGIAILTHLSFITQPSDSEDVLYDAKIKLSRQSMTEIQTLLQGEESWRTGALDNAISQILVDLRPHNYEAWKWRFEDTFGVELDTLLKVSIHYDTSVRCYLKIRLFS